MDVPDTPKPTTCGTCRHWIDLGTDPQNLGGPHQGECRCFPPQMISFSPRPGQVTIQTRYPLVLAEMNACHQYRERKPEIATA